MTGMHRIEELREVVRRLDNGEVVAIPTESFFALAARVDRPQALERLAQLKRGRRQPIGLMAPDQASIEGLVAEVTPTARRLIERYWPGPLTVVFAAVPDLSEVLTAGSGSIGIRVPADPLLQELLSETGPLTATSANRPGEAPAVHIAEVEAAFPGLPIWAAVEQAPGGAPSTVVDARGEQPRVLRQGAVRIEA